MVGVFTLAVRARNAATGARPPIGPGGAEGSAQEERMRWNTPILFAAALAAAGCSTSSSPHSGAGSHIGSMGGSMELRLVDAPADEVKEIVVTIRKVTAHAAGGWVELASQKATVDLLKLQNGTFASLGVNALPSGRLTQIRLLVDEAGPNYVTTPDGAQHPLKVPSGTQSGIKLKLGVELPDCPVGTITLDFDGKKSIFTHPTGSGDEWILRPVVRLKAVTAQPGDCSTSAPPAPPSTVDPPSTIDGMDPPATTTPPADSTTPGTPTPNTSFTVPPISTGEPPDCGGVTCKDGQYCYNQLCIDGYTIY
jgi:hypothetical protein